MRTKIEISIIVVGYRSQPFLPACFESILKQKNCAWEIVYVENCPEQPATKAIQENYPFVRVAEPHENLGFARGCNFGAQYATGEYLFFLNPDTEIFGENDLKKMVDYMRAHPKVGLAGPILMEHGDITPKGRENNGVEYEYIGEREIGPQFSNLPGKIAWICGAAIIISKVLFEKVGCFDPDYFMYSDDVDLCLKVRKAGFSIERILTAAVMHRGGESTKQTWKRFQREMQCRQSQIIFIKKHYSEKQNALIWTRMKRRFWKYVVIAALTFRWKKAWYNLCLINAINAASK